MKTKAWIASVLTLSFVLMAGTAMAARGIIAAKPGGMGGSTGRIIVIDGGADPVSGFDPGSAIPFSQDTRAEVGDLVSFEIVVDANGESSASHLVVEIPGTVYSSPVGGLTVRAHEVVLVNGSASVAGKITVSGGGIVVVTDGVTIDGKVEGSSGAVVIIESRVRMQSGLEVTGSSILSIKNSTLEGKVSSNGTTFTSVTNCTIQGKLEVLNATKCRISGNTVGGRVNTPGCSE